jgi:hypothetical protein
MEYGQAQTEAPRKVVVDHIAQVTASRKESKAIATVFPKVLGNQPDAIASHTAAIVNKVLHQGERLCEPENTTQRTETNPAPTPTYTLWGAARICPFPEPTNHNTSYDSAYRGRPDMEGANVAR